MDRDGALLFNGVQAKGKADLDPEINKINNRLVISESLRSKVLWNYHDSVLAQQRSFRAMYEEMALLYFWPVMQHDIKQYVKSCPQCNKAKMKKKNRGDMLKSMLNMVPFSVLFLDHVEIPAKNKWGYTHLITMMCGFTKFLIAEPVKSTSSDISCKIVFDRIVCGLGRIPDIMVVDNGFDSDEWKSFCKGVGARPTNTIPYNPRANQVERPHSFLKALVKINAEALGQDVWPELVQAEVRAYNSLKGVDKLSPFEALFGFQPDLPIEKILFPTPKSILEITRQQYHGYLLEDLARSHQTQRFDHLAKADKRVMQAIRDPNRFAPRFKVGDWVLVEQARYGIKKKGTATKCFYQCHGPHKIVGKREGVDIYEVRMGNSQTVKEIPGVRLRWLPVQQRSGTPQATLHWAISDANNVYACHSIGDIVAFKPPTKSVYANCNVQLAEIINIKTVNENQTILIHLFGPDIIGARDSHAHRRKWYPLYRSEGGGIVLMKDNKPRRETRSSLKNRVTRNIALEDILPIPAIELDKDKYIVKDDQERIRKAVKYGSSEEIHVTRKRKKEYVQREPRKFQCFSSYHWWWYCRKSS